MTASEAGPLIVRRIIRATPERLFDAWTRPDLLVQWWGPRPVTCPHAEVDLRVGGRYRIDNALPDGSIVTITGEFERISRPTELCYSWALGAEPRSRVTVRFLARRGATEVIITHEDIADAPTRSSHQQGWIGCLDGLDRLFPAA